MKNINDHIIRDNNSIREALKQINKLPKTLTLFVINNKNQLIGTLTDGDIRRGFINGLTLESDLKDFIFQDFHFLKKNEINIPLVKELRQKGIKLLPVLNDDRTIYKIHDLQILKNILPLECMIMAGGRGERLRPLTDNIPKPLLKIGEKPIIEHNIDRLIKYGIEKIYISLHYLGKEIINYLGDGSSKGIQLEYIWEDKPLGTVGALSLVKSFNKEYILLMNSDLFTDIDFEDLYSNVINENAAMGIASVPYAIDIPYAILNENKKQIVSIQEKPTNTYHANAGIYIINKKYIDRIPKNKFFNITDLIDTLIKENIKIIHNPIIGYWIDIGKYEDYMNAIEIVKHLRNE